jgi:hypothetical protein
MSKSLTLTLLLGFAAVLVLSGSYYVTDVRQQGEIERIQESRRAAALLDARVDELLAEESASAALAREALTRWHARYKYIPTELTTADMVEYLEGLTRRGFEQFDLDLQGLTTTPDFSTYTFAIKGIATYPALYDLVWHLENNREFYRLYDLKIEHATVTKTNDRTGESRQLDMVTFECRLDAYFAGIEGISAPEDSLKPIPTGLLAAHRPAMDLFRPLVRTDVVTNDQQLPDLERSQLVALIGTEAIFQTPQGRFALSDGDSVYLGYVEQVDPVAAVVRVILNKGDRTERLYFRIGQEPTRQRVPNANATALPAQPPAGN